jgi:hypothetical protein
MTHHDFLMTFVKEWFVCGLQSIQRKFLQLSVQNILNLRKETLCPRNMTDHYSYVVQLLPFFLINLGILFMKQQTPCTNNFPFSLKSSVTPYTLWVKRGIQKLWDNPYDRMRFFIRLCYGGTDGHCIGLFCIYIYFSK